ncbi:F-box domain, Leucine-rich repeat domain, L domain-like protein [Artemisia annua]|uniref:F-box domain, Leucine-rich repeat domain, L domain-like protein n=1 Tax=Artemisia annua TaxID=35608 RepID=A0A2U1KWU9_ARTAN|nr:F-box domain, Leucine-rich repeat domain, L domain-like protein [Artemisia annua]
MSVSPFWKVICCGSFPVQIFLVQETGSRSWGNVKISIYSQLNICYILIVEHNVFGVDLKDATCIRVDLVVVAIGFFLNTSLFEGQLTIKKRGIIVNNQLQTSNSFSFDMKVYMLDILKNNIATFIHVSVLVSLVQLYSKETICMDPSETTEMEEKTQETDTWDRFSQLPDSVAHKILVLLLGTHPKDLIRMSVLSKTWFAIIASFPILNFDLGEFYKLICLKIPFDKCEDDQYVRRSFFNGLKKFEISGLPNLEKVQFAYESLKLSSKSLKTFLLYVEYDLEKLDLYTPNLLLFDYKSHSYCLPFVKRNTFLSKARMDYYPDDIDSLWFQKLRQFLDKEVKFKELMLNISLKDHIDVEELKEIESAPYELDHLELEHPEMLDHPM